METRTHQKNGRTFHVVLCASPAGPQPTDWRWTVAEVFEGEAEIMVPGIDNVVAPTEEAAFERVRYRIDKWVDQSETARSAPLIRPSSGLN